MSDELRWLRETCEAGDEEARLRAEVEAWMDAEGRAGRLRQNRHAPMWREYEAAAAHQQRAGATLNSVWPELLAVVEAHAKVLCMVEAIEATGSGVGGSFARQLREHDAGSLGALGDVLRRAMDDAKSGR